MTIKKNDIHQIDGTIVMKDDFEMVIQSDDAEYTKEEFWEMIRTYEMWDITITLKDEYE